VQLRLFMMRSQAEQLQSRQQHLREFQEKLRLLLDLLAIVPIEDAEVAASVPYRTARLGGTMVMGGMTQAIGEGSPSSNGLSILSLIEAQEEERLRISRQIHDGPTQTLSNLILRAEICERLIDRDVAEARLELRGLKSLINASLQDTRRLIFDLRPMTLDDLGLVPTVRRYLVELGRINGGFQGDVEGPEHDTRLSSTIQVALFRFIQSLLHALLVDGTAESLDVTIAVEELSVRILVEAAGLETERAEIEEQLNDSYFRHRLELLQGSLTINPRPHRGMAVELIVNIPGEGALS
jgi:two-component system sensor histidine kinase DegS